MCMYTTQQVSSCWMGPKIKKKIKKGTRPRFTAVKARYYTMLFKNICAMCFSFHAASKESIRAGGELWLLGVLAVAVLRGSCGGWSPPQFPHSNTATLNCTHDDKGLENRTLPEGSESILGRTDNNLCSVTKVVAYLVIRQKLGAGPFFKLQSCVALTRASFVSWVYKGPQQLRIDTDKSAGHQQSRRNGI